MNIIGIGIQYGDAFGEIDGIEIEFVETLILKLFNHLI